MTTKAVNTPLTGNGNYNFCQSGGQKVVPVTTVPPFIVSPVQPTFTNKEIKLSELQEGYKKLGEEFCKLTEANKQLVEEISYLRQTHSNLEERLFFLESRVVNVLTYLTCDNK